MTCCCLEIITAAILSRLIGVIIVLGEHIKINTEFELVQKKINKKQKPNFETTTNTLETWHTLSKKWDKFKTKFTTVVLIKIKMEATDWSKKAINVLDR